MYKQNLMINMIVSFFGILLGLLICFSEAETLLRFVFGAIAVCLFFMAIPSLILLSNEPSSKERTKVMIVAITMIVIGAILLIYPTAVSTIVAGVILLVIPIYNIVNSIDKKFTFKKEVIKLALGVILILCGVGSLVQIILYIIGGLVCAVSLFYLIYSFILYIKYSRKDRQNQKDNGVIDV